MKDWILNAYSNIGLDCYWQIHNKDILKKKKTFRKHLRFSELSLNCTHSFLLNSFFYFMRSIQISNWNEQENLTSVCATSVSKSLGLFASLPGHIITSIVKIQLVRLVAPLTSFNRKSSKLQQDGYPLKTILLRWLFRDALN